MAMLEGKEGGRRGKRQREWAGGGGERERESKEKKNRLSLKIIGGYLASKQ